MFWDLGNLGNDAGRWQVARVVQRRVWGGVQMFFCSLSRIEHRAATWVENVAQAGLVLEGFALRAICFWSSLLLDVGEYRAAT